MGRAAAGGLQVENQSESLVQAPHEGDGESCRRARFDRPTVDPGCSIHYHSRNGSELSSNRLNAVILCRNMGYLEKELSANRRQERA